MNARNILTEKPVDRTGPCEECDSMSQGHCEECAITDLIRYPLADTECPECNGYGYHAFGVDSALPPAWSAFISYTHPPLEIQRDDNCDCCAIRSGHGPGQKASDTDAALLFVHDLELGVPHAQAIAREMLETEL